MRKLVLRLGFSLVSATLIALAVACGGAKEGSSSKTPGTSGALGNASTADTSGAASSGAATPSAGSSGGTTTTTQLGTSGDLQGAKLGEKSHTEIEVKGDAGPKNTHGQSAQEPGRSAKDIQTIVMARRDEARACYDNGLAAHPGIEGDLDVKWVIDPQGNVVDASVDTTKSSIIEPSVGACVVDVIKKIKFAASSKGYETRAHYPFNFHPKASGKTGK